MSEEKQNFVLMFDKENAPKVESGLKRQTVRKRPKRMPRVCDNLSLRKWTAKAYRSKQGTLIEAPATRIQEIKIDVFDVTIDGKKLSDPDLEKFARADGFEGWDAVENLLDYFCNRYDLPFQGIVIHW